MNHFGAPGAGVAGNLKNQRTIREENAQDLSGARKWFF
jgi:hypothetical protein